MTLEKYLQDRRIEMGLSQGDLAKKLGLESPQYISNCEREKCTWSVYHFVKLSKILEADPYAMVNMRAADVRNDLLKEVRKQLGAKRGKSR